MQSLRARGLLGRAPTEEALYAGDTRNYPLISRALRGPSAVGSPSQMGLLPERSPWVCLGDCDRSGPPGQALDQRTYSICRIVTLREAKRLLGVGEPCSAQP